MNAHATNYVKDCSSNEQLAMVIGLNMLERLAMEIFSWYSFVNTLALPENAISGWPESDSAFLCQGVSSMEASSSMNLFTDYLKNHHGYEYQAFLHDFDLCKRGHKSRHDLYCDMVVLVHQNKDLLAELRKLLIDSASNPNVDAATA
ncbi:hypothetical protein SADUNF_Sadunf04G0062300 [Salix dunnii]|uniref:Uncharacterized protein n=1 Tax=Salix dunnii TaxID=1413687 RepID=A0A835MYU1_9ROSI|nr:hypothetical protein SADUNF_Sadunf04G0062300 [Salix dunnii]